MTRPMDEDVAYAIQITSLCQELHCLPRAGGLLDQDSYHVWIMEQVLLAQNKKAERDQRNAK